MKTNINIEIRFVGDFLAPNCDNTATRPVAGPEIERASESKVSHRITLPGLTALLFLTLFPPVVDAQQRGRRGGQGPGAAGGRHFSDHALVNRTAARSIGPEVMSGRIVDIAVAESPGTRGGRLGTVIYVAAATGGVWNSTSGGVDWDPIFDDAGVGSVGDVTVAPSASDIVWVGTGEPNNMRSSSYGDGVYKSVDGGATFEHTGLRTSQHVGRIIIHPEDPDIVYVAALTIDRHTGVTDLAMDPTNPAALDGAGVPWTPGRAVIPPV